MAVSLVMSFLVPKFLGIDDFGYFQLFLLYATYTPLGALGLNDGLCLIHGGNNWHDLSLPSVKSQFLVGVLIQVAFGTAIVGFALASPQDSNREFVLLFVALHMLVSNTFLFFSALFQATDRVKLYVRSWIVCRLTFLALLIMLLLAQVRSFEPYVVAYTVSHLPAIVYGVANSRDLFHARFLSVKVSVASFVPTCRVGIKVTLSAMSGMLILGGSRLIVDSYWGIETFGGISLALSIVTFFSTCVAQASIVLFPSLRRIHTEDQGNVFALMRQLLSVILPTVYLFYFPSVFILETWLPQYSSSFFYLALLLPICVFDSRMNVGGTTFFRVLRKERLMLAINLGTLLFSIAGALVGAFVFSNIQMVLGAVVLAIICRSLVSEFIIVRIYKQKIGGSIFVDLATAIVFVLGVFFLEDILALLATFSMFLISLLFNRGSVYALYKKVHERKKLPEESHL